MGITMDSRLRCIQTLAVMVVLSGCATQPSLRISSQPEGAWISGLGSGEGYGMAPALIRLDEEYLQQHRTADGCYIVDGVEARWVSGATSTLQNIRLCENDHNFRDITLSRPAGYPGLAKDLQMELQLRETQARERQAAAESAAYYAAVQQAQAAQQASDAYLRERIIERREREQRARDDQRGRPEHANADHDNERPAGNREQPAVQREQNEPPDQTQQRARQVREEQQAQRGQMDANQKRERQEREEQRARTHANAQPAPSVPASTPASSSQDDTQH